MKVVFEENRILEKIHPYVKTGFYKHQRDIKEGSYVNLHDFNSVYSYLNSKEKYEISCLLEKNGIELATPSMYGKTPNRSIKNKDINQGFKIERGNSILRDNLNVEKKQSTSNLPSENLKKAKTIERPKGNSCFTEKNEVLNRDELSDNWETEKIESFSNIKLCQQIQKGNILAEEILFDRNKGMVKREALRFSKIFNLQIEYEDLLQAGYIGLLMAARRMQMSENTNFSSFFTRAIRTSMREEIASNGFFISIPPSILKKIEVLLQIRIDNSELDEKMFVNFAANKTKFTLSAVAEALSVRNQVNNSISMNTIVFLSEEIELQDLIKPKQCILENEIILQIYYRDIAELAHACLHGKHEKVIDRRMGFNNQEPQDLEQIGVQMSLTKERIRQIELRALEKIRRQFLRKNIRN